MVGEHRLPAVRTLAPSPRPPEGARGSCSRPASTMLPVDILGYHQQWLLALATSSSSGRSPPSTRFASVQQGCSVLEDGLHPILVGDEVGRDVALVELQASVNSSSKAHRRRFLNGDDTVLADLANASAMISPILLSCAETVATCAISSCSSTSRRGLEQPVPIPRQPQRRSRA